MRNERLAEKTVFRESNGNERPAVYFFSYARTAGLLEQGETGTARANPQFPFSAPSADDAVLTLSFSRFTESFEGRGISRVQTNKGN